MFDATPGGPEGCSFLVKYWPENWSDSRLGQYAEKSWCERYWMRVDVFNRWDLLLQSFPAQFLCTPIWPIPSQFPPLHDLHRSYCILVKLLMRAPDYRRYKWGGLLGVAHNGAKVLGSFERKLGQVYSPQVWQCVLSESTLMTFRIIFCIWRRGTVHWW